MRVRVLVLVTIISVSGLSALAAQTPRLPLLPKVNVGELPAETRKQVQEAYDAARQHPDDAAAVGKLGMLLDLYRHWDDAVVCYRRAHLLLPQAFKWLYYWGSLLLNQKKMREAVPVLTSAVQLRPEYLAARLKLAEALLESGQSDEAAKAYQTLVQQYPDSAEAHYGMGRIYARRQEFAAAAQSYGEACKMFPTYGAAHYALAMVYRQLGQKDKAQEQLRIYERNKNIVPPVEDPLRDEMRALDSSAVSYVERGVFLDQVGRTEDAIRATERAVELDPKLVLAHTNLISLYGRTGNLEKAEQHYRAVMALNPEQFPKAHYDYGLLLMARGRFQEAEEAFRRATQIDPSYAEAHNNLGYLLERQGKLPEALAEYRKALESKPDYRRAHFNLGRVLVNQQKYQEGIEQLSQTLTPEDEHTPTYLYALGAAYGRVGDRQNALRYLRLAREKASALGQAKLLTDIEQDLHTLEGRTK
jgi:tetratricopeptide (TPR) repeat protein